MKGNRSNHPRKYARLEDLARVEAKIDNIMANHLPHICQEIKNLRWFIMGAVAILAIVLAMLQVFK